MSLSEARCNKVQTALVVFIVIACQAHAPSVRAQAVSVEELQQRIEQRDALILDLQRRVDALEQNLAKPGVPEQNAKTATQSTIPTPADADSASEEEPSRALERTLVREGGIVLPAWSMELEPRYTYSYRGRDVVQIVTVGGQQVVAQEVSQRDRSDVGLNIRLGLPLSSQVNFRLPYIFDHQETVIAGSQRQNRRRSGLGDIELGWTNHLIQQKGWIPDLLTNFNWKSDTGDSPLGTGFHALEAGLTAVKRRDPLVFFGSASHNWSLSGRQAGRDVDLGNTIRFKLGTLLATSPETSLRFGFEVNRFARSELDGRKVDGSNRTAALFEFGIATIVLPRTLMDLTLGIGLTPDSPDFRLSASFPIRLF